MVEDRRLRIALALLEGRLHKASGAKRCGCGPCAHWVAVAARRAGISRGRLEAALPPVAKPEPRRRMASRQGRVRICESSTIRVRGRDVDPREGFAILSRGSTTAAEQAAWTRRPVTTRDRRPGSPFTCAASSASRRRRDVDRSPGLRSRTRQLRPPWPPAMNTFSTVRRSRCGFR
jgi:hypothetical protein